MTTVNRSYAGLGDAIDGDGLFGGETADSVEFIYPAPEGLWRATYGWGHWSSRVFTRSSMYSLLTTSAIGGGGFASISITSASGAIVGRIRTDIQKTILQKLRFTVDSQGCSDFELTLNALPDFPILPMSIIRVNVGNTYFDWFTGVIENAPEEGTFRNEYVYRGFGLRKYLDRTAPGGTYSALSDVGEIVDDIALNYITVQTPIGYNASKIDTTGIFTINQLQLSSANTKKILETLSKMGGAYYGVDGDGEFFYSLRGQTTERYWTVGSHLTEFEPEQNTNEIRNYIEVRRQGASGTGETGWTIGAYASDPTSIAKYGLQIEIVQVPAYMSDDDCQVIADAVLADKKDPKYYAKVKDIEIRSEEDYIRRGNHLFINTPSEFSKVVQECDDSTDWDVTTSTGTDITLENDTTIVINGAASIKATWTDADGYFTAPIIVKGTIRKIKFWTRSNRTGNLIYFGCGLGSYTQNMRIVSYPVSSSWFLFEWDVSDLNLTDLNEIGFEVIDNTVATNVWVDRIEIQMIGSRHYTMEFTRATYEFTPGKASISSAEFGPPPMRAYDYIGNALALAEENKFVSEQR